MRLARFAGGILCMGAALVATGAVHAQAGIYLETLGPSIVGESTVIPYRDHIVVLSGSLGAFNPPCTAGGLSVSEYSFQKAADRASVDMLAAMQQGTVFSDFIFRFVRSTGEQLIAYQTYNFKDVVISSYSAAGSEQSSSESWAISFSQLRIDYVYVDAKGGQLPPESVTIIPSVCPGS